MADKRAGPSASLISQAIFSQVSAPGSLLIDSTDADPDLIVRPLVAFDDEDDEILDNLYRSVMDTILAVIADEMNDGEALAVLHLTAQIVEAEELYADESSFASEPAAFHVIAQIVEAEPNVERADTEDGDSEEYGELDFGDFFDCWG